MKDYFWVDYLVSIILIPILLMLLALVGLAWVMFKVLGRPDRDIR